MCSLKKFLAVGQFYGLTRFFKSSSPAEPPTPTAAYPLLLWSDDDRVMMVLIMLAITARPGPIFVGFPNHGKLTFLVGWSRLNPQRFWCQDRAGARDLFC